MQTIINDCQLSMEGFNDYVKVKSIDLACEDTKPFYKAVTDKGEVMLVNPSKLQCILMKKRKLICT